jgi:hypothetical protein
MCWSKYEDLRLNDEEERRRAEELRCLKAAAEKRAERRLSKEKEKAREPVRS